MQAIQVKYLSATNLKPSRIKAWSYSGKHATLNWDDSVNDGNNFANAAMALLKKLEWAGTWFGGELPNNDYAFVCFDFNTQLIVGVRE